MKRCHLISLTIISSVIISHRCTELPGRPVCQTALFSGLSASQAGMEGERPEQGPNRFFSQANAEFRAGQATKQLREVATFNHQVIKMMLEISINGEVQIPRAKSPVRSTDLCPGLSCLTAHILNIQYKQGRRPSSLTANRATVR